MTVEDKHWFQQIEEDEEIQQIEAELEQLREKQKRLRRKKELKERQIMSEYGL